MEGADGGSEKVKNAGGKSSDRDGDGNGGGGNDDRANVSEALRKCLEENKGDHDKCKPKVEALKSFPKTSSKKPPLGPLRLRSGSLTDV